MQWQNAIPTLLEPIIALPRLGLVTDVDGTISPIVDQPDDAQVTPRSRDLLQQLVQHLPLVAVISGRAADDVRARVGVEGVVYVGNHGLEWWVEGQIELAPGAQQFRPALAAALYEAQAAQLPGMLVEDKGATLSIHYRNTPDPQAAHETFTPIVQRIAAAHGLSLFQGRMVYELRPPVAINKGSAFAQLITRYGLEAAFYLGDDTTDADALQKARELRTAGACAALGLGVTAEETPQVVYDSADVLVPGVTGVESFLAWLLEARSASST
ncbi:MAG: trehalose-phosphatase [Chloroflexi bacterium]|nr:trehalose-phosphatase [Chloroflexota bacterium]